MMVKIHSNPPILYYGFNVFKWFSTSDVSQVNDLRKTTSSSRQKELEKIKELRKNWNLQQPS